MPEEELPLYLHWVKFLDWLLSRTEKFPRRVRLSRSNRLENPALDFLQDLVEARIHYLALYPDDEGNLFNDAFFRDSPSVLSQFFPDHGRLDRAVRVIDVEQVFPGCELNVVMDADKDRALGYVRERSKH